MLSPSEGPEPGCEDRAFEGAILDGRYRVGEALGAGGMATVYLATDERLDRRVVVKTPHPALVVEKDFRARFEREIRSLTKIEHPHVLKVHDTGTFRDLPYAVMQHLSGGSLADRIAASGGRQRAAEILPWLLQVADALDHIHARGLVHRDIKPGNILYDDAGNVVVADFGIAKAMGHIDTGITATGVTPGSPGYMAPEVLRGGELGPPYDQYSLAVCVYEALCGQLPYPGTTPLELLAGLMSRSAADLSPLVPEIPPDAASAVMRALARDPEKRFATCTEFAKTFQTALGVPTVQVFPEQFRAALRRKRWMRVGIAAAALAGAAAIGAGVAWTSRGGNPEPTEQRPRTGTAATAAASPDAPVAPAWTLVTPEGAPPAVKVSPLQIETAKRLGLRVWFENELGMRFVLIPPGKFTMGSPETESGRDAGEKQREVVIDAPFYMQTTEVTNAQMRKLVPDHATRSWSGADCNADELPAGDVSPAKAKFVSQELTRVAGRTYAVPSESQWEYACRAGTTTRHFWGEEPDLAGRYANVADLCAKERWPNWQTDPIRDGYAGAAPAGSMEPNPWGLREILGNILEQAVRPDGQPAFRGGVWAGGVSHSRSAGSFDPTSADALLGLRLVAPVSFLDRGPPPWPLVRPEGAPPDVLVSQAQIDEAKKLGVPVWFENSLGMRFVLIPSGTFTMGSPTTEPGRGVGEDQREVRIDRSFYLMQTEVTLEQYRAHDPAHVVHHPEFDVHAPPDGPVASVTLGQVGTYILWANEKTGGRLRLPREEEWEYAARASTRTVWHWGTDSGEAPRHANVCDRRTIERHPNWLVALDLDDGFARLAPVASFLPNPWGLHDVIGNVGEFVSTNGAVVWRGGGWTAKRGFVRAAARGDEIVDSTISAVDVGFRLACDLPSAK